MKNYKYLLYIFQNGNTNQFKIGKTNNLNRRLAELQTGCPGELKVIKIWSHYKKSMVDRYERTLQRYYTKCGCRIRPNGEWFVLRKPDIYYLTKVTSIQEQNEFIKKLEKMM